MAKFRLMTSQLSPFSLKIQSCLAYTGHSYECLPAEGGKLQNMLAAMKVEIAKRRGRVYKYPRMTALDEYPGVPFLIEPKGRVQYDSSAISKWLDTQPNPKQDRKLWPKDPALAFVAQFIDEAMDDFGINIAHHMRWLHSAQTNTAGSRLFKEFSGFPFFALKKGFPAWFSKRQVKRLPYLLGMPAQDFQQDGPNYLKAPIKKGWPATHELLDTCWGEYITGLEAVLSKQAYLLGARFTIADASVYGMFGILLDDPAADQDMFKRTPVLHNWLIKIKNNQHVNHMGAGELRLSEHLKPLLSTMVKTFVPLMQQNEAAYISHMMQGETLFNEAALREGITVQVWRDLLQSWQDLPTKDSQQLRSYLAGFNGFRQDLNEQVAVTAHQI